jgi:glycosyltransferase involved in cell wall biosynthesis
VSGVVSVLGSFPRVRDRLSVWDLFLLPSEKESFGLSALEAMACGVPVIASDTGGVPEVVSHGETGYLYPIGSVAAMSQAAIRLLGDPEHHAAFARNARRRAVEVFGESQVLPLYLAAYEDALEAPAVSSGR